MRQDCVRKSKSMMNYAPGQDLECTFFQCFCSQTYNSVTLKFSETNSVLENSTQEKKCTLDELLSFHCRILARSPK